MRHLALVDECPLLEFREQFGGIFKCRINNIAMSADHKHPQQAALEAGVLSLGLALPPAALHQMLRYLDELQKWNGAYNLTAIRDPAEMVTRHLLDSLTLLPHISGSASRISHLLDVGSGAGLPAFPLAIAAPALRVTALDSNGKKARFMRHAQRNLGLNNLEVMEARVEKLESQYFDCIVSRAFGSMAEFFAKTSHLLAPGGVWVAMKGKLDAAELAAIPHAIAVRQTLRVQVPGLDEARHLVFASPVI